LNLEKHIKNCSKGNIKSQSILYENYKDMLFAISLKYCRNREEAQDNLQDTFLEIFKNINKLKNKSSFEGWIKRIAINKAIDKYKQSIKSETIDNYTLKTDEVTVENINNVPLSTILNFIQQLPNQYRLVFNLYELDNYSHKEIAKLLSISPGTSKSNLFRAKKILKNNIDQYQMKK
jgi:RNA polymerase sigma factor (sigma-70 family)